MNRRSFLSSSFGTGVLTSLACNSALSVPPIAEPSKPRTRIAARPADDLAVEPSQVPPELPESKTFATIYLQPLGGTFSSLDADFIDRALEIYFPHPVKVLPSAELPRAAYYAPRSRYRAEKLLDFLKERTPSDAQVIVGLTAVDISTTKGSYEDWGILGLATLGGRQCVVSRYRAQRGARNEEHTRIRLAKTVIHEVGHTLGLDHCPHHGCIMEDGKGSVITTDHEFDICESCRKRVGQQILDLAPESLPWPQPSVQAEN